MYKKRGESLTPEWLKAQTIEDSNGCWIWQRALSKGGYGNVWYEGNVTGTHRAMYALTTESFDPDLNVLHDCDVPPCINPAHLYQGTQQDNVRDCISRGRFDDRKGEANHYVKLTNQQVKEIRQDPRSLRQVAEDYPIGHTQVGRIRRRELWTHI